MSRLRSAAATGKGDGDFSIGGQGKWARGPRCECWGFVCACVYICKYSFCTSPRPSVYMCFSRGGCQRRSGEALALVSLRERLIYEGPSTVPLHNVPIRGSRHCGSVHHLAPATSTPGGVEIVEAGRGWEDTAVHYLGISYRPPLKPRPAAPVYSTVDKRAKEEIKKKITIGKVRRRWFCGLYDSHCASGGWSHHTSS